MQCPYCQKEMKEGYIPFNSPFVLKWYEKNKIEKVRVSDKVKWTQVSKIGNVFYCADCGIFIKKI